MTISTTKRKFSFLVIMAVAALLLLTTGTASVMAGGEPGAGCGVEGLKYDPAPYIGTLTVEWVEVEPGLGDVTLTGSVEQSGNSGCSGDFDNLIIIYDVPYSTSDENTYGFIEWNQSFLRGQCLDNIYVTISCPDGSLNEDSLFEVVAAGGIKWALDQKSFSAKFVIMHMDY